MITNIRFISRVVSQQLIPVKTDALISIKEPLIDDVALHPDWASNQLLRLSFYDVDAAKDQDLIESGAIAMSPEHAEQIVSFIKNLDHEVNTIHVACLAGISRSAGVAQALAEYFNLEQFNYDYPLYNRHVYRLVSDALNKKLPNRIKCNYCGDIIESKHRHDFKFCKCGKVGIDGGSDYRRRVGLASDYQEMCEANA